MFSSYRNNFEYTSDSVFTAKGEALVVFVNLQGDVKTGIANDRYDYKQCAEDMKAFLSNSEDIRLSKTTMVRNKVNTGLDFEWIIYTIAPFCNDGKDWFSLCDCYRNCINTAAEHGVNSVFFPHTGGAGMNFMPDNELLFYVRYVINDTVNKIGGRETMNVTVQLPRRLYELVVSMEAMISGAQSTSMSLHDAHEFLRQYKKYIDPNLEINKEKFNIPAWVARKQGLTYNAGEYMKTYIKRAELTGDFIREHRRAACYESVVKKIQQEKEACLALAIKKEPAADIDDVVKRFKCRKIDDMIQEWCDKPVPERERGKYGRRTNTRNALAKTVGLTSQMLSDITRKYKLPSRDTLLALAVGMKLPYEERLEFCLCRDENIKYPATEKEKLIERVLEETGYAESDMSFVSLNDEVYQRSGEKFSIYDVTKANTKSVKTKDKKTKSDTL